MCTGKHATLNVKYVGKIIKKKTEMSILVHIIRDLKCQLGYKGMPPILDIVNHTECSEAGNCDQGLDVEFSQMFRMRLKTEEIGFISV